MKKNDQEPQPGNPESEESQPEKDERTAPESQKKKNINDLLIYIGIITGIGLLGFGVILFLMNIYIWKLSFCVGFGLILASFGTSADVKYRGITVTGAGAVAIILFVVLARFGETKEKVTYAYLDGDFDATTQIIVEDKHELLGAFRGSGRQKRYVFIFEGTTLFRNFLTICIDEAIIEVHRKHIEPYLQGETLIEWRYDAANVILTDKVTAEVINETQISESEAVPQRNYLSAYQAMSSNLFFSMAYAETLDPPAFEVLFNDLLSESLRVRKESRDELVKQELNAIEPMMIQLSQNYESLRTKTGILYALSTIYKEHSNSIDDIRSRLSLSDIELLVKATSDEDKTISRYAKEFLYGIADPRTLSFCLKQIEESINKEEQFNAVLIIMNFFEDLPAEEQSVIISTITNFFKILTIQEQSELSNDLMIVGGDWGTKTDAFIDSFMYRWFVILGSFSKLERPNAESRLTELVKAGYTDTYIIDTDKYPNLKDGLWAVVLGPYSKSYAKDIRDRTTSIVSDAYIKVGK